MNKRNYEIVWGIDVSKEWLDISIDGKVERITQTKKSINTFIKKNKAAEKCTLAVVESTGGYERLVVDCLSGSDFIVHVAHPNKVRAYAAAKGCLAKTDKLDAIIIEGYGKFIDPKNIHDLPNEMERRLSALNSRLVQLKESHHQECCRHGVATEAMVKRSHQDSINWLLKQIKQIKAELLTLIQSDEGLKEKYKLLISMKGVGPALAITLIADLPELGKISKKEVAALVGVAPLTKESGKRVGKSKTRYGRFDVRKVLYMGALTATRHNHILRPFYQQLLARGKLKKVALVAVMRKMIVILNTMVQTNTAFKI